MSRKRILLTGVLCIALWLTAGTPEASQRQGIVAGNNSQTDIVAGVVVDYMGKLRFEVYQQETKTPIEGVAVEVYITSLGRYVLLGLTDVDGASELDITTLYLNSSEIQYQLYKSGWLPYPYRGTEILEENKVLHVVTVYLYRAGTSSDDSGSVSSSGGGTSADDVTLIEEPFPSPGLDEKKTGGIPKTGVGGAIPYWVAGSVFFLLAGGIMMFLEIKE